MLHLVLELDELLLCDCEFLLEEGVDPHDVFVLHGEVQDDAFLEAQLLC